MRPSSGDRSRIYRLPTSVLVYCFRRVTDDVEYLLLRRTEKYGGFWQGVTGALEVGETYLDGAKRELWEETRYLPERIQSVDFGYSFPMQDEWRSAYHPEVNEIHERVFLAEVELGSEPILSFEHDAFEWLHIDRALAMLKWPNNRDALQFCHRQISALAKQS